MPPEISYSGWLHRVTRSHFQFLLSLYLEQAGYKRRSGPLFTCMIKRGEKSIYFSNRFIANLIHVLELISFLEVNNWILWSPQKKLKHTRCFFILQSTSSQKQNCLWHHILIFGVISHRISAFISVISILNKQEQWRHWNVCVCVCVWNIWKKTWKASRNGNVFFFFLSFNDTYYLSRLFLFLIFLNLRNNLFRNKKTVSTIILIVLTSKLSFMAKIKWVDSLPLIWLMKPLWFLKRTCIL